jgi:hypothetical protein
LRGIYIVSVAGLFCKGGFVVFSCLIFGICVDFVVGVVVGVVGIVCFSRMSIKLST